MRMLFYRILNKFLIVEYGYKFKLPKSKFIIGDFENLRWDEMTLDDLHNIKDEYSDEISERKFDILKQRIANENNIKIYIVKDQQGESLGYFSLAFNSVKETGVNCIIDVNEESGYLFDDYVFKNSRGRGVQLYSILQRLNEIIKLNKKYAIVNVYSWNTNSIRNYLKFDFKIYIKYKYYKLTNKLVVINTTNNKE